MTAAWPAEELEDRAGAVAAAAAALLVRQTAWRHRRVETLTVLSHEQVRRGVSVDFTVPEEYRDDLLLSGAGECAAPLALLSKRPLVHFDLRNEEGHAVPLLTAQQHGLIARELLYLLLDSDLADQDVGDAAEAAVTRAAAPAIEAVLAADARTAPEALARISALEDAHALAPLHDFRAMAEILSRAFVLWAVLGDLDRRHIVKFAYDEPFSQRPGLEHFYDAPGCTEAGSYHVEVAVPPDLKARTTRLVDAADGRELAVGARNTDRPALYYAADPAHPPAEPGVAVAYGAERGRFLVPAAIVACVITLILALPAALADLEELAAGGAGPAIGLVLSTSAVFSALVLRTDEHPLLRLILVRYRVLLVASTLAALLAAALLGFRADPVLLRAGWAAGALVSAVAATILVRAVTRSPSARSDPADHQP